jgi:hypothetical protein
MGILVRIILLPPLLAAAWSAPLSAEVRERSAEIETHVGAIDGNYSLGGGLQYNVTRCMGLRSTLDAVVDAGGYSQFLASANVLYGLWYCCIPAYYVRFVYLTAGAGTYHRMGKGGRIGEPAVNMGAGAKIAFHEKVGLEGEVRDFVVLAGNGRENLWAFHFGLFFIL